jgi:hypothetical protein
MAMAGWYGDPLGLHERRFFNGTVWTDRVMDHEVEGSDSLGNTAPPPPLTPTVSGIAPQYTLPPPPGGAQYGTGPQYGTHPQYVVAQQYVVVNQHPVGNGFAITALVLGIIGILTAGVPTFALILGVLALVFGLLGRRNARERGASLGGLAVAGIVLGCIALALGTYWYVEWHRFGNAIRSSIERSATANRAFDSDPVSNKIHITTCNRDTATGAPRAMGTLVNTSGRKQAFRVAVEFKVPGGTTTLIGEGTTGDVSPGATASWVATNTAGSFLPTSCKAVPSATSNP